MSKPPKRITCLADECVGTPTIAFLQALGCHVITAQQIGLRGVGDRRIFDEAVRRKALLLTNDEDFTDPWRYPPALHYGIIVIRWSRKREAATHMVLQHCLETTPTSRLRRRLITIDHLGFRIVHQPIS